jgi:hypothetical protein
MLLLFDQSQRSQRCAGFEIYIYSLVSLFESLLYEECVCKILLAWVAADTTILVPQRGQG